MLRSRTFGALLLLAPLAAACGDDTPTNPNGPTQVPAVTQQFSNGDDPPLNPNGGRTDPFAVQQAGTVSAKLTALEQSLTIQPGDYDWRTQVSIERQIADAWVAFTEGKKDEAVALMRAAADLDDATEKHPVTPGAILPAREQLGELLLEEGLAKDALAAYEASLKRAPRRLSGLYGAARSAKLAGDASEQ